ncbi:MAG: hypothetical protein ACK5LS_12275 [Propioniciclava sp.]
MRTSVIWLDHASTPQAFDPDPLRTGSGSVSTLACAGLQAAPDAAAWVDAQRVSSAIILTRPDGLSSARYFAAVLAGARPELRLTVDAPGAGRLASLALGQRALALRVGAAETLAAFTVTAAASISGTWLRSLARLKTPAPTLGQYLRSLVSRQGAVVTMTPEPVVRPPGWMPSTPPPPSARLLVATATNVPQALTEAFPEVPVSVVPPQGDLRNGNASGVEFLVEEPGMLRPTPTHTVCPICGDVLFTSACPFCHVIAHPQGVAA